MSKVIRQPTSYGVPKDNRTSHFFEIGATWISVMNRVLQIFIGISIFITVSLLIFAVFFVEHTKQFASDGTQFSCEFKTDSKESRGQR